MNPDFTLAHKNLANVLSATGKPAEAIPHFQEALRLDDNASDVHNAFGLALSAVGRFTDAVAQFKRALQLKPDYIEACNNLAWIYATDPDPRNRNGPEAVRYAQESLKLAGGADEPSILDTLAAAYAEAGQLTEAVAAASKAEQVARSSGRAELARDIERRRDQYQARLQPQGKSP
jgi:protein O-mannosyl-transferase